MLTTALLVLATVPPTQGLGQGSSETLAITHVSVVDVVSGLTQPDMTVMIEGRRIATVSRAQAVRLGRSVRVLDGSGKFLIPGLWDMHVHTGASEFYLPLYIANGITGVRDMGGVDTDPPSGNFSFPFDSIRHWRRQINEGQLLGPRIVAAGVVLDGPDPWPGTLGVSSPEDARQKVDSLHAAGVDFIKITSGMPRRIFEAVAEESRRRRLDFVGHTAAGMTAEQAAEAGQRSVEHVTGLPEQCMNEGRCSSIFRAFVDHGTWVVPTLVAWRHLLFRGDSSVARADELRFIQPVMRQRWDSASAASRRSPRDREIAGETFGRFLRVVHDMSAAGVRLLAGSDAANPYTVPGFDLHEELEWLVIAGLTPVDALRAATINPAAYLRATDSLGTVRRGKLADLVLLRANPLDDIRNTTKIAAVIVNGRLVADPASLLRPGGIPRRGDPR